MITYKVVASVVIYKHSYEEISVTLNSLFQSNSVDKVILVDNDTSDWASKLEHEKVVYIKSKGNFGFGYGHNLAIKKYASKSNFFLICNPDVSFEDEEFEKLINFSVKRKEGLFLPKIIYPSGFNQFGARLLPTPLNLFARRFSPKLANRLDQDYLLKSLALDRYAFVPNLSGCFMLFKSSALLALEGFDERFFMYLEDVDLSRRCAEKFGTIYYPLANIVHKHEQASYKNHKLLKAHLKSAIQYFNKWGWFIDTNRSKLNAKCLDNSTFQIDK